MKINKYITSFIIGINSGLSYALLGSSFTAYLKDNNIDLITIGLLSLRLIPYSFKFLWAPIVDSLNINLFASGFSRRKSWLITTQILLLFSIISLGIFNIEKHFYLVCTISFITSFLAATYDIAMEAYRIELFRQNQLNRGTLFNVLGFRFGLILSGAGSLYLSSIMSWQQVFLIIAALIIPCILIISKSTETQQQITLSKSTFKACFKENFLQAFTSLLKLPHFLVIAMVISFYKLSDAYLDTMLLPFLLDMGYSKIQLATITKTIGIGATVGGAVIGAYLIEKYNIIKLLAITELLAASSNLLFISLIKSQTNSNLLMIIMCVENIISGICNIVLISYMSSLCTKKFAATHFAILISISGLSRTLFSTSSGWIATHYGWLKFFFVSSFLSIPSLICIYALMRLNNSIKS